MSPVGVARQQVVAGGDLRVGALVVVPERLSFFLVAEVRDRHRLVAGQDAAVSHNAADAHIQRGVHVDRIFFAVGASQNLFQEEMRRIEIAAAVGGEFFGDVLGNMLKARIIFLGGADAQSCRLTR